MKNEEAQATKLAVMTEETWKRAVVFLSNKVRFNADEFVLSVEARQLVDLLKQTQLMDAPNPEDNGEGETRSTAEGSPS